jgi:hypothetical protein
MEVSMIELRNDRLTVRVPEVHDAAVMRIDFQRTLRIPDDDRTYPLPAGLGRFPLRHVDDHVGRAPERWVEHGGVMLPMYQSEALWINFDGHYPFAVKIAAGKINAVTGKSWSNGLNRAPQDYLTVPEQPWLDGYCVEEGVIRQFVAMPLGAGYTAEEQLTDQAEHGGMQIVAFPMKRAVYERRFGRPMVRMASAMGTGEFGRALFSSAEMGLAPGGRMRQEIYDDPFDFSDWDTERASRCFVHLTNSLVWRAITDEAPPTTPYTSREYEKHDIPWFDYYSEGSTALEGSKILAGLKSVLQRGKEKGDVPLPENESVAAAEVVKLRKGLTKEQVREGRF